MKSWSNVVYDAQGNPDEWCGHYHENATEAFECGWKHSDDPSLDIYVVPDFDAEVCTPCVHLLHPAECERCLTFQCIHLHVPSECDRCNEIFEPKSELDPVIAGFNERDDNADGRMVDPTTSISNTGSEVGSNPNNNLGEENIQERSLESVDNVDEASEESLSEADH